MICVICGARCKEFDARKWTHVGVDFRSEDFHHIPIPVPEAP